ncbi:hypothetical protein [Pseudomonas sp. S2_E02]
MNNAQKVLIEKTLRVLGWAGILITAGILIYAGSFVFTQPEYTLSAFIRDLFSLKAVWIVWWPLGVGVVLLWLNAFVRASRTG